MGKKIDEMRKAAVVDLNLPMHDSVKGTLEEVKKIKKKGEHPPAKAQPTEPAKTKPADEPKPVENTELSDEIREKLLTALIDGIKSRSGAGFNQFVALDADVADMAFLAQMENDGTIRKIGKKDNSGREIYEFTEKGFSKYARRILPDDSYERLLSNFIDLFKEGQEVDFEALATKWVGCWAEVDAFLARASEAGEIEKNDDGKYQFTEAGLSKYVDKIYWYPAFRLVDNPFATFDAGSEHRAKVFSFVPLTAADDFVPMVKRVKSLISARASAIIEGERGCGKTSVVAYFETRGEDLTTVISPRNVKIIEYAMNRRVASKIGQKGPSIVRDVLIGSVVLKEKMEQYRKAVFEVGRRGLLLDVPDDLSHKAAFELANLCARILDEGGLVIILATPEQARALKSLDTFARFPVIKFERPKKEFFKSLFAGRLDAASIVKPPKSPLSDGAINRIADAADRNPRRFILLCGHLLTEMRERGADKPIDEKMADELLKDKDVLAQAPIDVTGTLQAIMRDFGSKGAGWIKLKVIRAALAERYGLDLRPETMGRRLTEMGYQRRYAPSAEYLASG